MPSGQMSALRQKQTCAVQNAIVRFTSKADMCDAKPMSALCQKRTWCIKRCLKMRCPRKNL